MIGDEVLGDGHEREARGGEQGAAEEQRQSAEAVGEPSGEGPQHERGDGEAPNGETGRRPRRRRSGRSRTAAARRSQRRRR